MQVAAFFKAGKYIRSCAWNIFIYIIFFLFVLSRFCLIFWKKIFFLYYIHLFTIFIRSVILHNTFPCVQNHSYRFLNILLHFTPQLHTTQCIFFFNSCLFQFSLDFSLCLCSVHNNWKYKQNNVDSVLSPFAFRLQNTFQHKYYVLCSYANNVPVLWYPVALSHLMISLG